MKTYFNNIDLYKQKQSHDIPRISALGSQKKEDCHKIETNWHSDI